MSNTDFHLGTPPAAPTGPLAGKGVLITRPMWQAVPLAQALGDAGAAPIIFPAIIIEANEEIDLPDAQARLLQCTRAFFVSANAVRQGLMGLLRFPAHVRAYGPGPGTAAALHTCGATIICSPTLSYDTVGLLAMPELQSLSGERVMVFTAAVVGQNSKSDLADALRARGASVEVVACYIRRPPDTLATGVEQLCAAGSVHASILTSAEGIANFWDCLSPSGRIAMQTIPAFVPHPNVAAAARSQGITNVIDCGPGDEALLLALNHYFSGTSPS
jgi:uroporphyrinogen-III synthase